MKARKLTLLAAILSAFALAACDKAEDTAAPVEPPVSEAPLSESPAVEPSPIDEANTLPEAAPESEFSQTIHEAVDSVKETTEELVESARETAAAASEKVKELTDSAIETTKQATEDAKAKAEEAVENVRQSFSSETGVSDATVDPTAPIEPEVSPVTSEPAPADTSSQAPVESAAENADAVTTEESPDLVGEIIEKTEEASAVEQNRAEQALEEVKEAGVEVREAVETDLEEAANALSPSTEATTESVPETDSQAGANQ